MTDDPISEELVAFLHAISDDRVLCERLLSLEQIPLTLRQANLLRIVEQMRTSGDTVLPVIAWVF